MSLARNESGAEWIFQFRWGNAGRTCYSIPIHQVKLRKYIILLIRCALRRAQRPQNKHRMQSRGGQSNRKGWNEGIGWEENMPGWSSLSSSFIPSQLFAQVSCEIVGWNSKLPPEWVPFDIAIASSPEMNQGMSIEKFSESLTQSRHLKAVFCEFIQCECCRAWAWALQMRIIEKIDILCMNECALCSEGRSARWQLARVRKYTIHFSQLRSIIENP